jgi:hypothetical protein
MKLTMEAKKIMKTLRSEIMINAPAEHIWSVLADFASYPTWNPFLTDIRGNALFGKQLSIKAKLRHLPTIAFNATITTFQPPVQLGWRAIFWKGVFEAFHSFEIEQLADERCRLIHTEEFSGSLCKPIIFLLERGFRQGYQAMNETLKARVERKWMNEGK